MQNLRLTLPKTPMILAALFGLVWITSVSVLAITQLLDSGLSTQSIPLVLMACFGAFVMRQALRARVVSDGDTLIVHNRSETVRFERHEIAEFRKGQGPIPRTTMIAVIPKDGEWAWLEATTRGRILGKQNDAQLEELNIWLRHGGTSSPLSPL